MKKLTLTMMAFATHLAFAADPVCIATPSLCNNGTSIINTTGLNIPKSPTITPVTTYGTPPIVATPTKTTNVEKPSGTIPSKTSNVEKPSRATPGQAKAKVATQVQQNKKTKVETAANKQSTAQKTSSGSSIFGNIFSGEFASILQVGSVIAQETGDEKTAKYLLGAGGILGAGDVAQDVMNGTADGSTILKGVAAAGSIYAATSGDEDKVKDFGRGAAILGSVGAVTSGDFNNLGTAANNVFGGGSSAQNTGILDTAKNVMTNDNTQILLNAGAAWAASNGKIDAARVLTGASAVGSGLELYDLTQNPNSDQKLVLLNTVETAANIYGATQTTESGINKAGVWSAGSNVLENMAKGGSMSNVDKMGTVVSTAVFGDDNSNSGRVLGILTGTNNTANTVGTILGTSNGVGVSSGVGVSNGVGKIPTTTASNKQPAIMIDPYKNQQVTLPSESSKGNVTQDSYGR